MNENENQLEKAINAAIDNVNSLMPRMEKCEGQETKIVELQKSIENFRKEIAALQQSNVGVPSENDESALSFGERFVKSEQFKSFQKTFKSDRKANVRVELTAAPATTQASNSYSRSSLAAPAQIGIVTDPRQVLNMESLFGHIMVESNSYEFYRYGFKTTETATGPASVAEGSAKPESNYSGTIHVGTIKTIAHWTKLTEQMLADNANIVSFINDDMKYQLDDVVDYQIVRGSGSSEQFGGLNKSGNYTDYITGAGIASGDTEIDLILKVKSQMEKAGIRNISLILNPEDWCKVLCQKNVNKDYLIPGIVDIPMQRIWGVPVILNANVQSGKFHMGNFYQGGKVIERSGVALEMDREQDDFTKNLVTLRAERRLDFAVVQPKALCYGDFSTS